MICALLATFSQRANSQQVFGSIFGTVTDSTGGAVANAKVTIVDKSKGTSFEVTSDSSGNYTKGQLIADPYQITIESPGFQKAVSNEIPVRVDEVARFDVTLQVGDVSTQVEVTATAPLLQTDKADVATTFTAKEINALPNIGRNLQSMELLNPGTAKIGWQHASDENPQGSVQMIVNGQLFDSMGYQLDGTTNQDPILGIIVINPTFDSISEVKQANQDFDAEFEYVGGGNANYTTRSGSNTFHGDAFEYLQLNTPGFTSFAANPFTNLPAATYRQNQFGGSIGGRVIKDKLFVFGDAQLNRQSQGGSILTSVPTAQDRLGNFGDWLASSANYQIYDPKTGDPTTGVGRKPYAGNIIPTSDLSPQALALLNYFPLPNHLQTPSQPYINNYVANGAVTIDGNQWDTREDYYINEKNSMFGRYSYASFTEAAPGVFGALAGGPAFVNYAGVSQASNQSLAIGETYSVNPTLINEFRFGWMRYHVFDVPNGYGTDPAAAAGIPGLNLDKTYTSGLPYFDITTTSGTSQGTDYRLGYALGVNQCNCPLTQTEKQLQFVDNLTKIKGNHSFKFGADIRFANNLRVPSDSHRAGEVYFAGTRTGGGITEAGQNPSPGIGLATFLLGDVTQFQRYVSSSTDAEEDQPRLFFYAQDTWHPTPKWTLTYGLRWEIVRPEHVNIPGNGSTLNLANGLMYVFGYGNSVSPSGIQQTSWHDFAPRIGVAYQLNPKTVIRAGYGWSYDLGVFGSNFGHNVTQNPPVLSYQNLQSPSPITDVFNLAQGPAGYTGGGIAGPAGLPAPIQISSNGTFPLPPGVSPKFRPDVVTLPQVYQYNATLQRQLTTKIVASVSYVGNSNRHNFVGTSQTVNPNEPKFVPGVSNTNLNRPYYPIYGWTQDLQYFCDCANGMYNSMQAKVEIRALAGLNLQGSYTYQRQWGPGWDPYDSNYYFMYDRAAGYGYGNLLPRNQITITEVYDIPFGKGRKYGSNSGFLLDAVLGGWNISGITQFYSGFPFSPTLENYGPNVQPNAGPKNRPDVGSGDPFSGAKQDRTQWFVGCPNADCTTGPYRFPASNTFGNYPINTLIGPQFIQQDLTLAKSFPITERFSFQLRTDARNVFNHTNLGLPNADVQSPSVGQITGLAAGATMRSLQFSGTVRF
ncbi:MAG TPA: TonB-dependent receptor [Bryobacteraceae bacterium]|nr:TonB-dependent receptor [Bryobacteraceae bacterium]